MYFFSGSYLACIEEKKILKAKNVVNSRFKFQSFSFSSFTYGSMRCVCVLLLFFIILSKNRILRQIIIISLNKEPSEGEILRTYNCYSYLPLIVFFFLSFFPVRKQNKVISISCIIPKHVNL